VRRLSPRLDTSGFLRWACSRRGHACAQVVRRCCIAQGSKKERLSQEESFAAVEEFCMAVHDKWPNCLVQFEGARPAALPPYARKPQRAWACTC